MILRTPSDACRCQNSGSSQGNTPRRIFLSMERIDLELRTAATSLDRLSVTILRWCTVVCCLSGLLVPHVNYINLHSVRRTGGGRRVRSRFERIGKLKPLQLAGTQATYILLLAAEEGRQFNVAAVGWKRLV